MTSFFEKRDRWGNGYALWVFAGMLFAIPMIGLALTQLRMTNDVESWLPKDDREARVLAWFKEYFPSEDRVLITWDGSSLHDERVRQLAEKFEGTPDEDGVSRNGSPLIDSVITAEDMCRKMISYGVEPDEAVRRLTGTLIGYGLVKVRLSDAGRDCREESIAQLRSLAAREMGIQIEVLEPVEAFASRQNGAAANGAATFPGESAGFEGETYAAEELPLRESAPYDFRITWPGMEPWSKETARFCTLAADVRIAPAGGAPQRPQLIADCFQSPGSPVGMLVTLSEAGRADEGAVTAEIRAAAASVGISDDVLRMGGRPITASELNEAVKRAAWNPDCGSWWPHRRSVMLLSGVVGFGLAFLFLRSLRLGVLVLAVSYYSTFLAAAMVPLTGESMNMVLMVMPTLLNVLTLSGAIHVANYWKYAASEDPRTAIVRAVEMARQPCALASITTAIGLISLMSSQLGPVRQFGLYSAIGCLIALGMVLFVLPALLQLWPAPAPRSREGDSQFWDRFGRGVTSHGRLVSAVCLVLFVVSTYGLVYFQTETKVIRYFPENARIVRDSAAIEQSLAGISSVETVIRFSPQLQAKSSFLERLEIVRAAGQSIREHPDISGVISLADFQPSVESPPDDAGTFTKIKYNRRSSEAERRVKSAEEEGIESFFAVATADVAAEDGVVFNQAGDELWRITAQSGMISDTNVSLLTDDIDDRVSAILAAHPGAKHVVTGTVPLFLRTQMAVLESLINSFAMAFAIIAVVMIVQLRSIPAGLLSMLPNLMPVGVVFGLLAWSGARVDVGAMVTASVALGIAVDGTLHLLTWFVDGIRKGNSRQKAIIDSLSHCGPAMWQTSAAVGLGLLMLSPAELLMISRFGWLMAALIGAALFADIVFLPALLTGPLGFLIERSIRRGSEAKEEVPPRPVVVPTSHPHFGLTKRPLRSRSRIY